MEILHEDITFYRQCPYRPVPSTLIRSTWPAYARQPRSSATRVCAPTTKAHELPTSKGYCPKRESCMQTRTLQNAATARVSK